MNAKPLYMPSLYRILFLVMLMAWFLPVSEARQDEVAGTADGIAEPAPVPAFSDMSAGIAPVAW